MWPTCCSPVNDQDAIEETNQFLETGKKLALDAFKNSMGDEKLKIGELENFGNQEILVELTL